MINSNFLAVDKRNFKLGLKSIDILILSQIEEFARNGCQCHITNKQLSDMLGECMSSVKKSLDKLEALKLIYRETILRKDNGKSSRQRIIYINYDVLNAYRLKVGSNSH